MSFLGRFNQARTVAGNATKGSEEAAKFRRQRSCRSIPAAF
jgi:hypothetical protein